VDNQRLKGETMIGKALIEGLIWSVLWMIYVYVIVKFFPWQMLHDYPKDIQEASTLKEPTEKQKKRSKLFGWLGGLAIICTPIIWGITQFSQIKTTFLNLFVFIFIIVMMWNVIDLLIMDWLIVCTITPKWVVIKGTEGCRGYKDYLFHFKGFLIGCIYTTVSAIAFSGIAFIILRFLFWK
jgi:hypothetical protein